MKTLQNFQTSFDSVPGVLAWYLSDLGEARGKQELFFRQSKEKLEKLKQHAIIESSLASNRIEGVTVDPKRIEPVLIGRAALHDRNEEEVRGYKEALKWIHEKRPPITEETIRELHSLSRARLGDAGEYKNRDSDIIELHPDGSSSLRFKTVSAKDTPFFMNELVALWKDHLLQKAIPPLLLLAVFNLDFLCIHPFRDGNGRVSRLLLLLQLYHLGYEVGSYISLEKIIEENKKRYYETLKLSSESWHSGEHDPWHYSIYLLSILKEAYQILEKRGSLANDEQVSKTQIVKSAISSFQDLFSFAQLKESCPTVGPDMLKKVLRDLKKSGQVESLGRGPGAKWKRKGITLK